jgi:protein CpxP
MIKGSKMKKTTIVMTALLGLSTTLFASGFGGKSCQNDRMYQKHSFYKVMDQLDLSDAQKAQFKALRDSKRAERKAQRKAMKESRSKRVEMMRKNRDLSQFMTADKFDKEAFKAVMKKRMEQREQMREKRSEAMLAKRAESMEKIFNILTPEQREKWIQLSKQPKK